ERAELVDQRLRKERHRRDEVLLQDREPLPLGAREVALVARARRVDAAREEPVTVGRRDPAVAVVDGDKRLEVLRKKDVVGVAKGDQLAFRFGYAAVAGGRHACGLLGAGPDR